jgi:8-oxo-dGTP pyrophosphatase MutT (NUDIX family)
MITELPTDKRIAGVHCVPLLDNGNIVLAWDVNEKTLTTIGGRLEPNESIEEALDREALEEAGLVLENERKPFVSWYWEQTDTYTVWVLARVQGFVEMPQGYEKTGYIIANFLTAIEMIHKLEGEGERIDIIKQAGKLSGYL